LAWYFVVCREEGIRVGVGESGGFRPPSPARGRCPAPQTAGGSGFAAGTGMLGFFISKCIQWHNRQGTMGSFESFKQRAEDLMSDVYALYLARSDPRIPWYAKVIIVLTVVYALSPIDLIPDFIPFVGYLDDLIIIPAGIALAVSLMPKNLWEEYRERAKAGFAGVNLDSGEGILLILFIIREVWKILAIGLTTFMIGFILMVILYPQQGLLNMGTIIFIAGLVILFITYVKFRSKLNRWRNKVQSSQKKEISNQ
jgi:uncharacterized membrane protein YkvA (DUF1232 family)